MTHKGSLDVKGWKGTGYRGFTLCALGCRDPMCIYCPWPSFHTRPPIDEPHEMHLHCTHIDAQYGRQLRRLHRLLGIPERVNDGLMRRVEHRRRHSAAGRPEAILGIGACGPRGLKEMVGALRHQGSTGAGVASRGEPLPPSRLHSPGVPRGRCLDGEERYICSHLCYGRGEVPGVRGGVLQ